MTAHTGSAGDRYELGDYPTTEEVIARLGSALVRDARRHRGVGGELGDRHPVTLSPV